MRSDWNGHANYTAAHVLRLSLGNPLESRRCAANLEAQLFHAQVNPPLVCGGARQCRPERRPGGL